MKRISFVDLLRSLSIAVVLATHLGRHHITQPSHWPILQTLWFKIWENGATGVMMFFVISGFLITRLLASDAGGLYRPNFRRFYVRRIGRLFPLLGVICLLGLGIAWWGPDSGTHRFDYCFSLPPYPYNLFLGGSIASFSVNWFQRLLPQLSIGQHWINLWSLSVEEQFYFCYPFVLSMVANKRNLVSFLAALILLPLLLAVFIVICLHQDSIFLKSITPYASIATGCLAYLACEQFHKRLEQYPKICWIFLGAGLFLTVATYSHYYYKADFTWIALGPTLFDLGVFLLILGGIHLDVFETKNWQPFSLPGQLSYGLYLLHIAVLFLLWPLLVGINDFVAFAFFSLATIGIGWLSYHFFERPMNTWIRKTFGPHELKD